MWLHRPPPPPKKVKSSDVLECEWAFVTAQPLVQAGEVVVADAFASYIDVETAKMWIDGTGKQVFFNPVLGNQQHLTELLQQACRVVHWAGMVKGVQFQCEDDAGYPSHCQLFRCCVCVLCFPHFYPLLPPARVRPR